jgi:hypothetical protein
MLQKTQLISRQQMKEIFSFEGGASELEVDLHAQIFSELSARQGGGKHEKEFDGPANNMGVIANRPYMDTWLTCHPYIGSVTETRQIVQFSTR